MTINNMIPIVLFLSLTDDEEYKLVNSIKTKEYPAITSKDYPDLFCEDEISVSGSFTLIDISKITMSIHDKKKGDKTYNVHVYFGEEGDLNNMKKFLDNLKMEFVEKPIND